MARVLSICLGLLIWLGGSAWGDKPKIAVLGLEPAPGPGGAIDPGAQLVAKEITKELRQRVANPACPYVMALNSNKELIDEKALMSCDNEAVECMVVISAGLASDALLYGRVDKRGESFRVSLKLLDVKRRTVQAAVDDLPVGGAVSGVSRRLYSKLIGDGPSSEGSLLVRARSDSGAAVRGGAVKIDDEIKGQLAGGKLAVPDLLDGPHTVAIEVPGHRRFEEIVMVHGGAQATLDAQLQALAGTPGRPDAPDAPHRPSPLWKWAAGASIAVALGGGGYAFYSYDREVNHNSVQYRPPAAGQEFRAPDASDCGKTQAVIENETHTTLANVDTFNRACTWHRRTYIGIAVASAGTLAAIASLIIMSRDPGPPDAPAAGAHGRKPELARAPVVAPILAPGFAGAQLSLSW